MRDILPEFYTDETIARLLGISPDWFVDLVTFTGIKPDAFCIDLDKQRNRLWSNESLASFRA